MPLEGVLDGLLASPWLLGGLAAALAVLVAPFLLRPTARDPTARSSANANGAGRDLSPSALSDLEGHIDRLHRRIDALEDERRRILERIADCRRRGDERGEKIHERDHLQTVRLKRRARESLRFLKDRYHRIRAALYALEDEQMKIDAMDLQRRTPLDEQLHDDGDAVDRLHEADAELDAYLHSRPTFEEIVDDPPKDEVEENRRLIEAGLKDRRED